MVKYVIISDNNIEIRVQKPTSVTKGVIVAECDTIPRLNRSNGEYYEAVNIQEHSENYTEKEKIYVDKTDENGYIYTEESWVEVEKTRNYFTCELVVKQNEIRVKRLQLKKLKSWFNNEYRYYNEKLTRFAALNIAEVVTDKVFGTMYLNLSDLYIQAEKIRGEINALEEELKSK